MQIRYILIALIGCFIFPACTTLDQGLRREVDILKSRVVHLESNVAALNEKQLSIQDSLFDQQLQEERYQGQVYQNAQPAPAYRSQDQVVQGNESYLDRYKEPEYVAKTNDEKFISDKMASPPTIHQAQIALRNAGFYNGSIDGIPGSGSRAAVIAFQRQNGLEADGIIGNQTWRTLKRYL